MNELQTCIANRRQVYETMYKDIPVVHDTCAPNNLPIEIFAENERRSNFCGIDSKVELFPSHISPWITNELKAEVPYRISRVFDILRSVAGYNSYDVPVRLEIRSHEEKDNPSWTYESWEIPPGFFVYNCPFPLVSSPYSVMHFWCSHDLTVRANVEHLLPSKRAPLFPITWILISSKREVFEVSHGYFFRAGHPPSKNGIPLADFAQYIDPYSRSDAVVLEELLEKGIPQKSIPQKSSSSGEKAPEEKAPDAVSRGVHIRMDQACFRQLRERVPPSSTEQQTHASGSNAATPPLTTRCSIQ